MWLTIRSAAEAGRAAILVACAELGILGAQSAMADQLSTTATASAEISPSSSSPGATTPDDSAAGSGAVSASSGQILEVSIIAQRLSLIGTAQTASEGEVGNDELSLTPAFRPGQVLETVPGLDVTVHSGEGKANQYLLRGFNLDHGTELAVFVDDMPVNEPSHAHGQGYTDINFMIPELASDLSYTKGTYYADEGDFAPVGSVHINYLNSLPTQMSATVGTLGFQRVLSAGSIGVGDGALLGALELQHYDGPWTKPGDQREINGVLRYSVGDARQGLTLTAMFYHDTWNAQTDQPERALTEGLIPSVYGILDPSDAGYAQRASVSGTFHDAIGSGLWSLNAYVITNRLYLWNNFTHFLVDPIRGDQEQQHEDRVTVGADSSYAWNSHFLGVDTDWEAGVHARNDINDVSRIPTQDRIPLTPEELAAVNYPSAYSESDEIHLDSLAGYLQITSHWTERLRSVLGFRQDYMYGIDKGTNYGSASRTLPQPKGSLIYRAGENTELYANAGRGFHSNDLRGINQARIEGIPGAQLISSETGEEIGVRQQLFDNRLSATLAVYNLVAQSETTYNPDIGQDSAGPGSHRTGFEINVRYQPARWLEFDGSYSHNRARYTSPLDDGTGHLGEYLPNAPFATGSLNMYVRDLGPWSGGVAYRYLGAFPLTSGPCSNVAVRTDFPGLSTCAQAPTPKGQVFGSGYGEWSAELHYALGNGWSVGVAGYNVSDKKANAMEYFYVDRLPGEPAYGVADVHFHPLEPVSGRLTIAKIF